MRLVHLVGVLPLLAVACQPDVVTEDKDSGAGDADIDTAVSQSAELEIDPTSLDLGETDPQTALTGAFVVRNVGGGVLSASLSVTEGTDHFAIDTTVASLEAGEEAVVTVTFSGADLGDYLGTVTVLASDDDEASTPVAVGASVVAADADGDDDGWDVGDDCDDTNPDVNPGAAEVEANGVDDDCDGEIDEPAGTGTDADGDGYGEEDDCDDGDATVNPGATETWYDGVDQDCDGASDYDQDGDGQDSDRFGGEDCDDRDAAVYTGATEVWYDGADGDCDGRNDFDQDGDGYDADAYGGDDCDDTDADVSPGDLEDPTNGVDDDCDGELDEALSTVDADGDGYAEVDGDCDDGDATVNPGADETWYDGFDQDCDGASDYDADGDGADSDAFGGDDCDDGDAAVYVGATETWYDGVDADCAGDDDFDQDGDGDPSDLYGGGDCDDTDATVSSLAAETWYDGVDTDCDGRSDYDQDGDGYDSDLYGGADCDDADGAVSPGTLEDPTNGVDDDCDGEIDEALSTADADGDGWTEFDGDCDDADASVNPGAIETWYDGVDADCNGGSDYDADFDGYDSDVYGGADCDDTDDAVSPGAVEDTTNAIDDDCDGYVDETLSTSDLDGDGYSEYDGDCDDGDASINPAAAETWYDGVDQDCDGSSDYDQDRDGYDSDGYGGADCDDTLDTVSPAATEVEGNGIDDDCDGTIDESLSTSDFDGDGYSELDGDCDDTDATINPAAAETWYDGVDQDCDGASDYDQDGDGEDASLYGGTDCDDTDATIGATAAEVWYDGVDQDCAGGDDYDRDGDGVQAETWGLDCDDADATVNPSATEVWYDGVDQDCDGASDYDQDGDGEDASLYGGTDCDDTDAGVNTSATEVWYDGVDQDCDGWNDFDQDLDGETLDTFGGTDCVDTDAFISASATEVCDGVDNDCSGVVDDGVTATYYLDSDADGYGLDTSTVASCSAPSGYASVGGDCDDVDAAIHPAASEACDGLDNDCDGTADEGVTNTYYRDGDGDTYGDPATTAAACSAPSGYVNNAGDCDDTQILAYTGATESCDAIDNDCDGSVDEGVTTTYYADADADGFGSPTSTAAACSLPSGYVTNSGDCDDTQSAAWTGAPELCDAIDNDCDGTADEGVTTLYYYDGDGDSYGDPATGLAACSQPIGYVANGNDCNDAEALAWTGAGETCDSVDNDCDGTVDEGVTTTWYADGDGDGFGSPTSTSAACSQPSGYVANANDCDDTTALAYTGATEVCDSVDNDCDGATDEGVTTTWYYDGDGDGHGIAATSTAACTAPTGYVATADDCNDLEPLAWTNNDESCDSIDNDCDGSIDEGVVSVWYRDNDGDGYGDPGVVANTCSRPAGYVANANDCDDTEILAYTGATETCDSVDNDCDGSVDEGVTTTYYRDNDGDNYGNPASSVASCSRPTGYVTNANDCNDGEIAAYTGAVEVCDSVDNDCDGSTDEGVTSTYYRDADGDSYGTSSTSVNACSTPSGYVTNSTDCNDAAANANPAATEVCDSIDNDCDGAADEGVTSTYYRDADSDGFGSTTVTTTGCSLPSGYVTNSNDCNDASALAYTGATEVCDSVDNDCDGSTDEGVTTTYYADADSDGYGNAATSTNACSTPTGYVSNSSDCNDSSAAAYPTATEVCDGIDNDCDSSIDEGVTNTYYRDADADGYGTSSTTAQGCSVPSGYASNSTDCNDANASINPLATEVCDLADNDCDGLTDEGVTSTYYVDADADGYGTTTTTTTGCSVPSGYSSLSTDCNDASSVSYPGAAEICDGLDNDCDGTADDGLSTTTWYRDADADGFGDAATTSTGCSQPSGYVADATDCDDTTATTYPGAAEIGYDVTDNDCDDIQDEMLASDWSGWTITSDVTVDYTGYGNLLVTSDLDLDGNDDLVVGSPWYDATYDLPYIGVAAVHDIDDAANPANVEDGFTQLWGDDAGSTAGYSLDVANADNAGSYDELAVGAPYDSSWTTNSGTVYVGDITGSPFVDFASNNAEGTIYGTSSGGWYGASLAFGDFDGDGRPDLAGGAPGEQSARGRVYVHIDTTDVYYSGWQRTTDARYYVTGVSASDYLGVEVDFGDFNNDGYDDLVACSPYDDDAGSASGTCWIDNGAASPSASGTTISSIDNAVITGSAADDMLGGTNNAVAVGDLDDDGVDDLAVGMYGYDGGATDAGVVLVYRGGTLSGNETISTASYVVRGTVASGALGASVHLGDLTGDGIPDLVAGAPWGGDAGTGILYLFAGGQATGTYDLPTSQYASWEGDTAGAGFGWSVGGQLDLDGDGTDDFAVSEPWNDDNATDNGKVWVLPGY
ncbi:MAG: MopE-related protein [Myxococcota bacterium]